MSRSHKTLVVILVATLGLWGCSQGNNKSAVTSERLKQLEAKCAKLEADYQAAASAKDRALRDAAQAKADRDKIQETLAADVARLEHEVSKTRQVVKERDTLKVELTTKTTERDVLQNQLEEFRQSLKSLLGRVEAVAPEQPKLDTAAEIVPAPKL